MASSSPLGKDFIKEWFRERDQRGIKSIIDIGAGEGTYYNLLGKKYYWIAIEVWAKNIEMYNLTEKYDEVQCIDIRNLKGVGADCIIFGDILEHLPKDEAIKVLTNALKDFKHVVVSIPLGEYVQGAINGNPYEEHKSYWTYEEIENLTSWKRTKTYIFNPDVPELKLGVFIK